MNTLFNNNDGRKRSTYDRNIQMAKTIIVDIYQKIKSCLLQFTKTKHVNLNLQIIYGCHLLINLNHKLYLLK